MPHFTKDLQVYFRRLGLDSDADVDEIKRAYRHLAKKYHPDLNPSPTAHNQFIEITEAYEILINTSLKYYYEQKEASFDLESMRAEYERTRQEAKESARRYARMKYEKFRQEQEAFKKSGWHDLILTIKYLFRVLVFFLITLFIAMPLISEEVAEHPSGYVMFWLFAAMLIAYVLNNRKGYFQLDPYYYHFSDLRKILKNTTRSTADECYYCPGKKAMPYPNRIDLFRIRKVQLFSSGALYGRQAGFDRIIKTVKIQRSRKAVFVHSSCSLVKITCIVVGMVLLRTIPWSYFALPVVILLGSILSGFMCLFFSTRPKSSYFLSAGMLIKILIWLICIYLLGEYAVLLLFFDPIIEAFLRLISRDRLFVPLLKQHPGIENLLKNRYQFYLELPVWSVINPFFRWLF